MGTYRKISHGHTSYISFIPTPLAAVRINEHEFEIPLQDAKAAIDKLNISSSDLTEEQVTQWMKKEAEYSCMMALGKYISPFGFSMFNQTLNEDDQLEVDHLFEATNYAIEDMHYLPVSGRLLKNAHYLMCRSPRYEKKYPGEIRISPVWIGKEGCTIQDAAFIPPTDQDLTEAFSELEKFINADSDTDALIRAALIHYQFETIHPFIDANGRTGRLLNILFLLDQKIICQPVLMLSQVLSKYSNRYYMELQNVHTTGKYDSWIIFFLKVLKEAAETVYIK